MEEPQNKNESKTKYNCDETDLDLHNAYTQMVQMNLWINTQQQKIKKKWNKLNNIYT